MSGTHPADKEPRIEHLENATQYATPIATTLPKSSERNATPPPVYSAAGPSRKTRKRRPISSPPASFLHQSKKASIHEPLPEPDHREWELRTGMKDPVLIRDRFSFPVEIDRTQLSPAVSEASDVPTRPQSFRSASSNETLDSEKSAKSDDSRQSAPASSSILDRLNFHVNRLASIREQTRSVPSLRSVALHRTVQPRKSILVIPESRQDSTEDRVEVMPMAIESVEASPASSTSSPPHSLRHSGSKIAREARKAEENFARRLSQREEYKERREMLKRKDELRTRLRNVQSKAEEISVLRDLGKLYLTKATYTVWNEQGVAETKIMRKTAEMAANYLSKCVATAAWDDSLACYLLGRAHELLATNVSEQAITQHQDYALLAYQRALACEPDPNTAGQILCSLGVLYFNKEDFDEARKALEQSITVNPRQPQALLNYGQLWDVHYRLKGSEEEKDGAEEQIRHAYSRVLRLDPTNEIARRRLASLGGPIDLDSLSCTEGSSSRRSTSIASDKTRDSAPFDEELPDDLSEQPVESITVIPDGDASNVGCQPTQKDVEPPNNFAPLFPVRDFATQTEQTGVLGGQSAAHSPLTEQHLQAIDERLRKIENQQAQLSEVQVASQRDLLSGIQGIVPAVCAEFATLHRELGRIMATLASQNANSCNNDSTTQDCRNSTIHPNADLPSYAQSRSNFPSACHLPRRSNVDGLSSSGTLELARLLPTLDEQTRQILYAHILQASMRAASM